MNQQTSTEELADRRYLLQDRAGDYVQRVEKTDLETVKVHFVFTDDRAQAKVFTYEDLYSRLATNPVGIEFSRGFAGSRLIRV